MTVMLLIMIHDNPSHQAFREVMESGNPVLVDAGQVNAAFCYNMKKKILFLSEIVIEHTSTKMYNVINFVCAGKVS